MKLSYAEDEESVRSSVRPETGGLASALYWGSQYVMIRIIDSYHAYLRSFLNHSNTMVPRAVVLTNLSRWCWS